MSSAERPVVPKESRRRIEVDMLLQLTVSAVSEVKPISLVCLDLRGLCSFADHFLIASVPSTRQVRAAADRIEERLQEAQIRMFHREEDLKAQWILLDYSDVIIHIFDEEMRLYYDLEGLWADAPKQELVQGGVAGSSGID